jgi:integrase
MLVLQEEQLYTNFIESCRAPKTKLNYRKSLHYFMKYHNYTKYGDLINSHEYEDIKSYILDMKARQLSTISMKMHLCAIKCFYEMNDIENIKWKKLFRFRGEDTMTNEDRAYTHEEIQKMLTTADLRLKAVILLMCSSGMRIGALPTLSVGHLNAVTCTYRVSVYSKTSSKYITFITPEARKAIDDYIAFRERCGERITPDSPLFRNEFDTDFIEDARKNIKACSNTTLRISVDKNLITCGLKTVDHVNRQGKNRKPVQATHGFRKFFRTQLLLAKVDHDVRELLMGHSKHKLELVYTRLTEAEMYEEYSKAIDLLTIEPSQRLQKKVTELQEKHDRLDKVLARVDALEKELGIID